MKYCVDWGLAVFHSNILLLVRCAISFIIFILFNKIFYLICSETFTTLYYVLSVAFGDGKFLSDASIAIQNRVNVDTLRRNINFTRADGSEYEVIVRNSTAVGYRDTMPLFVGSTVARTDYSKFEAKLTALIAKEAISITNNQMVTAKIVKQERSISANGYVNGWLDELRNLDIIGNKLYLNWHNLTQVLM